EAELVVVRREFVGLAERIDRGLAVAQAFEVDRRGLPQRGHALARIVLLGFEEHLGEPAIVSAHGVGGFEAGAELFVTRLLAVGGLERRELTIGVAATVAERRELERELGRGLRRLGLD